MQRRSQSIAADKGSRGVLGWDFPRGSAGGLPELGDAKLGRGCDENLSISTEVVDRGAKSPAEFGGCQVLGTLERGEGSIGRNRGGFGALRTRRSVDCMLVLVSVLVSALMGGVRLTVSEGEIEAWRRDG